MSEKRAPANTFAWLLIIILVPWVGVPLYLLFGGRKLRRLAKRKSRLHPVLPTGSNPPFPVKTSPTKRISCSVFIALSPVSNRTSVTHSES